MENWSIDVAHSTIEFKVKYLVISTVKGFFRKFDARLETDNEDFTDARINFSAQIDSISTNNEERDQHLKSEDFFSAHLFPHLFFRSTSFQKIEGSHYRLVGDMTIHNCVKTITLDVDYGGKMADNMGRVRAGFEVVGKISRKEYGLLWDAVTETGSIMVGDEVRLELSLQMVRES